MDELETKVAEAIYSAWPNSAKLPWSELTDELRSGPGAQARAAIAVMREHSGGGYEAAARECVRRAGESGQRITAHGDGERRAYLQAARIIREHGQHVPVVDREAIKRIIVKHAENRGMNIGSYGELADAIIAYLGAQPVAVPSMPTVTRTRVAVPTEPGPYWVTEQDCPPKLCEVYDAGGGALRVELMRSEYEEADEENLPVSAYEDATWARIAMPWEQPAAPTTCANCNGTDITPPRCETCGARGDELAQPAAVPASEPAPERIVRKLRELQRRHVLEHVRMSPADERSQEHAQTNALLLSLLREGEDEAVPASEPFREAVRLGDEPSDVDAPRVIAALRARTASAPAPAASEPVVTDAMVEAFGAAYRACPGSFIASSRAGLRAALAAAPAASEPAAVTDAMADAFWHASHSKSEVPPAWVRAGLRAALAAAPQRVAMPIDALAEAMHDVLTGERWSDALPNTRDGYTLNAVRVANRLGQLQLTSAAAPQRVREVGEAEAERVLRGFYDGTSVPDSLLPFMAGKMATALRAAGLCVAVPDTEWAALVAERDGLRKEVEAAKGQAKLAEVRAQAAEDTCGELHDQLAAATKRAEDAEEAWEVWKIKAGDTAKKLDLARDKTHTAEARVRELEARPVVPTLLGGASVPVTELNAIAEREIAAADGARCSYARQGERVVKALMERMYSGARPVVARDDGARKALEALARMYDAAGDRQAAQSIRAGLNWEG